MKRKIKSKLILCLVIVSFALTGIIRNEFSVKHGDERQNSKNDMIADLKGAYGNWDPPITKSVGVSPYDVFIGDANNDGYTDIATANAISNDVSILLWNSTLSDWDSQVNKSVGDGPYGLFIGDANNDGYTDIATANAISNDVSILLWNSTIGDWDSQITKSVGAGPVRIFIGDANNDGYDDIVTSNYNSDNVSILLWNSTSSDWNPQITKSVGAGPFSVFIGDVNNDDYNDIITANYNSDDISIILWNNTSGDWDPQIKKFVNANPYSVFIGDANNDGYNDIVTGRTQNNDLSIFLWNSTSGNWDSPFTRSVGNYPTSLFIRDVNNDGYNDITTANFVSDDVSILLWNSTSGDWNPQITKSVGAGPFSVFIGDANNDGYNDIATANSFSDNVSIILWKPPYISIISPENKVYRRAYYNATYGFENDTPGDPPDGWVLNPMDGLSFVEVDYVLDGREYVVEIRKSGGALSAGMSNYFNLNVSIGAVEFWLYKDTDSGTDATFLQVLSTTGLLGNAQGVIVDRDFYYLPSNFESRVLVATDIFSKNTWHHLKMEFNISKGWQITIDGALYGQNYSFPFRGNVTGIQMAGFNIQSLFSGGPSTYGSWIDAIGYSWDPFYNIGDNLIEGLLLSFCNNTRLDWIVYSLDGQDNITIFEQKIITFLEQGLHYIQLFGRDSESGEIVESEIRYFTIDTINPTIIINSPIVGESFGCMAPKYDLSIIEPNLESIWYTIDGGITNFTINELSGFIDQHAWIDAPLGSVTIRFYAKDAVNLTSYDELTITKAKLLNVDIINHSFSLSEFIIEFYVYNESGEAIDSASIQMWWDGIDVSSHVQNLGNGYYSVSLDPITVAPGEVPILLNMTISASGYGDKYFETYIAVDPATLQKGKAAEEFPLVLIITISAISAGAIIGVAGIFWLRRRRKESPEIT
ncbi:MAG: FG-GAP repeat domain-containing protein [Candidatus Hodarchaeota archaeon]